MAGQHYDRALHALLAHQTAQFSTVRVGQANIQDHKVIQTFFGFGHRLSAIASLEDVKVLDHQQLFTQRLAQVFIIIDEQNFLELGHDWCLLRCITDVMRYVFTQVLWQRFTPSCRQQGKCFNLSPIQVSEGG